MNAKQLLTVIGEAQDDYISAAIQTREGTAPVRHLSGKRALLLAAVITLALLLVGCAVVYVLSLQEMKVGETTVTQRFNDEGRKIEPTEVQEDVISLNSHSDSPLRQATREWYEFLESYDTDKALLYEAGNDPNPHGIPDDYWGIYGCYTWDMVSKVDEIAQKYGLKLLSRDTLVQTWQNAILFEALGIEGICKKDAPAEIQYLSGSFQENGSFHLTVDFTLTGSAWDRQIWSGYRYSQAGYFDPVTSSLNTEAWEQWSYTTSDGIPLLLAMTDTSAYIFAERPEGMITVSLTLNTDMGFPYDENRPIPDKSVVEQAAEIFDYTIRPQAVTDYAAIEEKLARAEAEWEASQTVTAEVFHSFGEYLLNDFWIDDKTYVLYDLDGDGSEELLLGTADGIFEEILFLRNGSVESLWLAPTRLCRDGILYGCDSAPEYDYETHSYTRFENGQLHVVESLSREGGEWTRCDNDFGAYPKAITAEEAQAIRDRYTQAELEWSSALDYAAEGEGMTVGQLLRQRDVVLDREGRRAIFAQAASANRSVYPRKYYTFLDINNDGEEELLLGADEETFNQIYVLRHNRAQVFFEGTCHLQEGGIIARFGDGVDYDNGWYQSYTYHKLSGTQWTQLDSLYYWQGTDTWSTSRIAPAITQEEADAIRGKYTPAGLNMKPLKDLMAQYGIA